MFGINKNNLIVFQWIAIIVLLVILAFEILYTSVNHKVNGGVDLKVKIVDRHADIENIKVASKVYFNISGKNVDADILEDCVFTDSEEVTEGVVYLISTNNLDLVNAKVIEVQY